MLSRQFQYAALGAVFLLAPCVVATADFGTYREFRLGASTADVLAQTRAAEADVKTLHERPALLEELLWRPPYVSGPNPADRDSVASIAFSFVDNQLFRMTIEYDRSRTEGLTNADMIASLSALYGPRSTRAVPPTPRSTFDSIAVPVIVARWNQGDTTIALTQAYSDGFGLVITSVPLEVGARRARAAAVTIEAREAPAREAARAKAEADAAREAADKTRTTNKAAFKP